MKKFLYIAVAAMAALSSCGGDDVINDNDNQKQNQNENNKVEAPVFTATIEGEGETRTTLADGTGTSKKVNWLGTDKVFIGGFTLKEDEEVGTVVDKTVVLGEYSVAPGSDATTATLNPGSSLLYSAELTPQQIIGVYPASISNYIVNNVTSQSISSSSSSTLRNYALKITLPATQTYAGSDISKIAPMMAHTETGGNLEFKNITALLAITVPSTEMSSVQKITISSGKKLNGEVSLMSDGVSLKLGDNVYDDEKTLTLNCQNNGSNTAIPSGESKTFYVSIPPQTYGYLQIDVTDGTNTKTMKTKAASIEVARNTIYPIVFDSRIKSFTAAQSINAWKETDKISVNGVTYKFSSYVPDSYYLKATFVPEVEGQAATADASGKYYAIWPASAATDDGKINIPSNINSLSFGEIPIFAESTSNELSFQQLFTYCNLMVKSSYEDLKIKVNSYNNIKLSGTFDPKNWDITTSNGYEKSIVFEGSFDYETGYMNINIPLPAPRIKSEEYEISIHLTFNNGSRTDNGAPIKITFPVLTDGYDGGTRTLN